METPSGKDQSWWHRRSHTAIGYAHALKDPCDRHFPGAKTITLVQDNPDTHKKAPLYEAFPPTGARRSIERFEWVYTPDPRLRGDSSWLDMAESGLGVLSTQCLNPVPEAPHR